MITVNAETGIDQEGIIVRHWSNVISDEQAAEVAHAMTNTLDAFLSRPEGIVADLDCPKGRGETRVPNRPRPQLTASASDLQDSSLELTPQITEDPFRHAVPKPKPGLPRQQDQQPIQDLVPANALCDSRVLKQIVQDCVQHVLEQMFKTGETVSQSAQTIRQLGMEQSLAPEHLASTKSSSGSYIPIFDSTPTEIDSGTALVGSFVSTASVAASVQARGRSAKTEQKLLAIWSSMLDLPQDSISGEDSFFELGGDSITAMQLVGAAREEGLALTVADVFRNPVLEDMAAIIRVASIMNTHINDADIQEYNARNKGTHRPTPSDLYERFSLLKAANVEMFLRRSICPKVGVFKGGIADVLPVTDFQSLAITGALLESRWMLNIFFLDGSGVLDLRRLKQSCSRLVQAFDVLRTVFLPSGNRFLQVILRNLRPDFQVFETDQSLDDFTGWLQQRDRELGPRLGESFVQFTVAKQKGTDNHRIFVRMSHAQYDGVCFPRILNALQSGYRGDSIASTPSFANYVRASAGTVTSDHYQHWKSLLDGSSMTEIVRRNGPNYRRSAGATMKLKRNIRLPCITNGSITMATIIKAAWAYVLAQLSARSDILFGHTISGRNAAVEGVEAIVGPCLNVVPVRVQFEPQWTALDLFRHLQDQQVANMPYEALGFREIIKHCTTWPDWTNFTTTVQHQNVGRGSDIQLGENMYKLGAVGTDEDFADLSILSAPLDNAGLVEIAVSFSPNGAVATAFAEKVLEMLCNAAESFSANPGTSILSPCEIRCLTPEILDDIAIAPDDRFQSTHLQGLSRAELLILSDVLSRAWRQVLPNSSGSLQLESSFFDLGGDIMGLAQLAWLLEQEGLKLRLEDLIDHPTMLGQMAVLSMNNPRIRSKSPSSETPPQPSLTLMSPNTPILEEGEPTPLRRWVGQTLSAKQSA